MKALHSKSANTWQRTQLPHKQRLYSSSSGSSICRRPHSRVRAASSSSSTVPAPSVIVTQRGAFTWASCVSTKPSVQHAVETAVSTIHVQYQQQQQQQQQQGEKQHSDEQPREFRPDLAIVFASCNYGPQLRDVVKAVRRAAPTVKHIFGSSAFGVCGSSPSGPLEVEGEPGVSVSLAELPGVELSLVHTLRSGVPSEDAPPESWADLVGVSPVQPLTRSPPPSGQGSQDNDDGEDEEDEGEECETAATQQQQQQQQQQPENVQQPKQQAPGQQQSSAVAASLSKQQPPAPQASSSSIRGSSALTSSEQDLRDIMASSSSSRPLPATAGMSEQSAAVSFMVLADPNFPQLRQLLAGLDFAFPEANKVGLVLSQGERNRQRVMFAWSAEGGLQAGTADWRRRRRQRRQQQQEQAAAADEAAGARAAAASSTEQETSRPPAAAAATAIGLQQQQQQQSEPANQQQVLQQPTLQQPNSSNGSSSSNNGSKKGLFSSLFGSLLAGLSDDTQRQQQQQQQQPPAAAPAASALQDRQQQQQQQSRSFPSDYSSSAAAEGEGGEADDGYDSDDENEADSSSSSSSSDSGLFVYGAAVLAIKGPLVLEPLTCQGYRTVSPKVWVVGDTSRDGDLILNLVDPEADEEGEEVVSTLVGVCDMFDAADDESAISYLLEASDKLAVAIAPDSWSPVSALTPEQFTVAAVSEFWINQGFVSIDGQARPGHRLRFVLRDEQGMRDDLRNRLLSLKRSELAAVMAGRRLPQPLATMLLSDIGRGGLFFKTPHYEGSVVSAYLPVPLAGASGSAQVSTVNGAGTLYERTSVVAVWRALNATNNDSSSSSSATSSSNTGAGGGSSSSINKQAAEQA